MRNVARTNATTIPGSKPEAGKGRVRLHALRHGLLAKELLVKEDERANSTIDLSDDNKKKSTTNSALNRVKPAQLYQQCLSHEREAAKLEFAKLKLMLARALFFGQPLFESPPVVDEASVINKKTDLKIRTRLWQASKYREILCLLGGWTKPEDRLFLLAWWLSQEKVCEPDNILGVEVLRRMAKKGLSWLSATDFQHADTVRVWLPYFERLLNDFRSKSVAELVKLGYDEAAALAAAGKRSAIEAACTWLADRRRSSNVDAATLRNAYSRVYGTKRRLGNSHSSSR